MRLLSGAMVLVHLLAVSAPVTAWAQPVPPAPQPVPYPTLPPPVPYPQPSPLPPPPSVQRTPVVGQDVIYMKNGGILRGTIIDAIPGAQARIQLATGEIATVPWPEIARIEHGGEAPRPLPPGVTPTAPGPGRPPPPAPPRTGAMVWVHLEGPDEARLEQDTTGQGDWQQVCSPPCNIQLPTGLDYRIQGGNIKASQVFHLTGNQGDHVTVNVNAGSKAWFVIGIVITPIGAIVALVGFFTGLIGSLGAATASSTTYGSSTTTQTNWNSVAAGGWTTFAIGAAALVGGIVLIVTNSKTTTSQEVSGGPSPDAWLRAPVWREASPEQRAMPQVTGVPLWSGRF